MVRFAHLADCHLGGWRQEELQELNFLSFQKAVDICISNDLDFILIAGDLFDSAYPPIEILKRTFSEFRKIKEAGVPVFIIAGSHDFSASGKTFLDVLEKAGFCKNIENYKVEEDGQIVLKPYMFRDIALFGYSGKKSSMEIEDLRKIKFDSIYPFSIFMIHTTIKDVVGSIPMDSIETSSLPLANYYALGHIHKVFEKQEAFGCFVYPGPIFPNNFQELVDLKNGSFYIVNIEAGKIKTEKMDLKIQDIVYFEIEIENALTATERIIAEIDRSFLDSKIVLMRLKGIIKQGKTGDIRFNDIEDFANKKGAYSFLRNISSLKTEESDVKIESDNVENIEEELIKEYGDKNPGEFNKFTLQLINTLSLEKKEDEKSVIFENRLMDELKRILDLEDVI